MIGLRDKRTENSTRPVEEANRLAERCGKNNALNTQHSQRRKSARITILSESEQ